MVASAPIHLDIGCQNVYTISWKGAIVKSAQNMKYLCWCIVYSIQLGHAHRSHFGIFGVLDVENMLCV